MHLLLTDETNLKPGKDARFFIYGGLIVPLSKYRELDLAIESIRQNAGYQPADELKFDTRSRPDHVDQTSAAAAKREVIVACRATQCTFVAYAVLHEIAKKRTQDELILYGVNTVLNSFNGFLAEADSYGLCFTDQLPVKSQKRHFQEVFQQGLEFEDEKRRRLNRIRLYGSTWIGASHLASAVDIVLGAFRYCVNTPKNELVAADMTADVAELLWGERQDDTFHVLEKGLVLRPIIDKIKVSKYRQEYEQLVKRLGKLDDMGRARRLSGDAV